jgi:hypothetical protein
MARWFLALILILNFHVVNCQALSRNTNWGVGYYPGVVFNFNSSLQIDTIIGERDSVYYQYALGYGGSNISSKKGELLLTSNGFWIYNDHGNILKNGKVNTPFGIQLSQQNSWLFWTQMSTILPKSGNQYYVFTSGMSDKAYYQWKSGTTQDDLYFDHLCYHVVDMDANGGQGEVISKNNILMKDAFLCYDKMAAVQHGNGEDYWLVKQHKNRHKFYVFLITAESITLADSTDYNNGIIDMTQVRGQSTFSDDGTQYAFVSENWKTEDSNVYYYNFDRCTGKFSNYRLFKLPFIKSMGGDQQNGVAFSPNGRFLYVSSRKHIWQIDVRNSNNYNNTKISGPDTLINYFQDYLNLKLAPNGKIYVGNWNNVRTMSYINNPDEFGVDCNFVPRGLRQNLTYLTIPPNNPKYDMGPLAGSPCDTIRTHPSNWVLYPNPAFQNITIKVPNSKQGAAVQVQVYNLLGQKIIEKNVAISVDYEATLDVASLPNSIYILKANYGGEEFISKFVKG